MSKKIAEGHRRARARREDRQRRVHEDRGRLAALAESLVSIGNASGVRTEAVITAMDAPLGRAVGNALEVIECIEVLKGRGPADLIDVSVELTARMLVLGGVGRRPRRRRSDGPATRSPPAPASNDSARSSRRRAAIRASSTTTRRLPSAPERHLVDAPTRAAISSGSTPNWSAAPRWCSAPAAIASRTRSIPASASWCWPSLAIGCPAGDAGARAPLPRRRQARCGRWRWLARAIVDRRRAADASVLFSSARSTDAWRFCSRSSAPS